MDFTAFILTFNNKKKKFFDKKLQRFSEKLFFFAAIRNVNFLAIMLATSFDEQFFLKHFNNVNFDICT